MMTSSLLVLFMIVPGLALFYGGLVRTKNMLSVLMQCTLIAALVMVIWVVYGYSMAFGGGDLALLGRPRQGVPRAASRSTRRRPPSRTGVIPEYVFIAFQMTFAAITPGAHRRRLRRAHEVLGGAAVRGALGDLRLLPDRAHGLGRRRA